MRGTMADEVQISQMMLGVGLGSFATLTTNFIWNFVKENQKKGVLLVGLTSEIKVIREDFSTHLMGMRDDLNNDLNPRPDDLEISRLIFTANAGNLGLFGNSDFVDHLVETYSSLNSLINQSHFFKRFTNDQISRDLICEYHVVATSVHLKVLKLHKRLLSELKRIPQLENETEITTRALVSQHQKFLKEKNNIDWMHGPNSFSVIGGQ